MQAVITVTIQPLLLAIFVIFIGDLHAGKFCEMAFVACTDIVGFLRLSEVTKAKVASL